MTVDIKNTNGNTWGKYVLSNDDRNGAATVILGDVELGDTICNSLNYKSGNSVNFVISFGEEDNVDKEKGRNIAKEFMQEFMEGFSEEEYHIDMVEHDDTEYLHYHVRVPKVNLLTETQLKLYFHRSDLKYKKAVISKIANDHDLFIGDDFKKTVDNPSQGIDQINIWRDEKGKQVPLDLKGKKNRDTAERDVNDYVSSLINSSLINNLDDVKSAIQDIGLKVVKTGYDQGKDFHYFTVANESGKVRLKGDFYDSRFFGGNSQGNKEKKLNSSEVAGSRSRGHKQSRGDVGKTLERERGKRLKFIEKQYGKARERAYQRHDESNRTAVVAPSEHRRTAVEREQSRAEQDSKTNENEYSSNADITDDSTLRRVRHGDVSNTDGRLSEQENSEQLYSGELLHDENRERHEIDEERQLDDSVRTEVNEYVAGATRSIHKRIEEHYEALSNEHKRISVSNEKAVSNVEKIRGYIQELAGIIERKAVEFLGSFTSGIEENVRGVQGAISSRQDLVRSVERAGRGLKKIDNEIRKEKNRREVHDVGYDFAP